MSSGPLSVGDTVPTPVYLAKDQGLLHSSVWQTGTGSFKQIHLTGTQGGEITPHLKDEKAVVLRGHLTCHTARKWIFSDTRFCPSNLQTHSTVGCFI